MSNTDRQYHKKPILSIPRQKRLSAVIQSRTNLSQIGRAILSTLAVSGWGQALLLFVNEE